MTKSKYIIQNSIPIHIFLKTERNLELMNAQTYLVWKDSVWQKYEKDPIESIYWCAYDHNVFFSRPQKTIIMSKCDIIHC